MILIGSEASKIRGDLPPWRNGYTYDIDVVCSPTDADKLAKHFAIYDLLQIGRKAVIYINCEKWIECDTARTPDRILLERMSCNSRCELWGFEFSLISLETEYTIISAMRGTIFWDSKREKDFEYWSQFDLNFSDQHKILYSLIRNEIFHLSTAFGRSLIRDGLN